MRRFSFLLLVLSVLSAAVCHSREPLMVILFDDGRASQYDNAYRILEQYGLKGTFGIVTGKLNSNPFYLTRDQVIEMAAAGHEIHDHTLYHQPDFWGDVANAPWWRSRIKSSLSIFAMMGLTTRGWNQPGGTGEGWSQALRDTLALFYDYAAGRVGLEWHQNRNFHWHFLDDPFSLGRGGVFSWGYNLGNSQKQELENILTRIANGTAQGLITVPAFHNVLEPAAAALPDDSTAWAVAQICSFAVANDIEVLTMEEALYRARNSHAFIDKWGEQITNYGFLRDCNHDDRPDGWDLTTYRPTLPYGAENVQLPSMVAVLINGGGTWVYGPEKGTATLKFIARGDAFSNLDVIVNRLKIDYTGTAVVYKTTIDYQWAVYDFSFEVPEDVDRLQISFVGFPRLYLAHVSLKLTGTAAGVPRAAPVGRLQLWPNPAAGVMHAVLPPGTERVRIYDAAGRLAREFVPVGDRAAWDVADWPSGIYFASAVVNNSVVGRNKFLVIH